MSVPRLFSELEPGLDGLGHAEARLLSIGKRVAFAEAKIVDGAGSGSLPPPHVDRHILAWRAGAPGKD